MTGAAADRSTPSLVVVVPGRLRSRTGGYEYDRRIVSGLESRGWHVEVVEIAGDFPTPDAAALARAANRLAAIPAGTLVLVDGLAFGAMPDLVEREASRLQFAALVHLPLAEAAGLEADAAGALQAGERRALAAARLTVVTGRTTAATVNRYGVPADRIVVVEPGTEPAPLAKGSAGRGPLRLLTVAALTPGKGHAILLHALAAAPTSSWTLTCAGSLDRHPPTAALVRQLVRELGLDGRVSLVGEVAAEPLARLYDDADVFVLATLSETYGMAVAEALARGLPVVSTITGAIPALVGDDAGLLVPPGDTTALAGALSHVLTDPSLRDRLAAGARRARARLQPWDRAVETLASALEPFARHE